MESKYLVLVITLVLAFSVATMSAVQAPPSGSCEPWPACKNNATGAGGNKECNDGIDNDGDGFVDLADLGCVNKGDKDESNCGDNVCEGDEDITTCTSDCLVDSCTDSDGGFNPPVKGTATGVQNGQEFRFTDFCIGNSTVLTEYSCDGPDPVSVEFDCLTNSTGCFNGECFF